MNSLAPPSKPLAPPPAIHIRAPATIDEEKLVTGAAPLAEKTPKKKTKSKSLLITILAGVVVLLGAGGFTVYKLYLEPPPPPPPRKAPLASKPSPQPAATKEPLTPSETLNTLAAAPANAISKAQTTVEAQRANEQARTDALATGDVVAPRPPTQTVTVTTPPPKVSTETTIAPGVTMTVFDDAATAEASPAFRTFIAEAKVSSVMPGPPSRAFINGQLVRAGQAVDNGLSLGIVFVGANVATHQLTFKDRSGATVTRHY